MVCVTPKEFIKVTWNALVLIVIFFKVNQIY
jgi:hypothetical protein